MGIGFKVLRFDLRTGARRTEHQVQPRSRPDSDDSIWFVALAKEQWSLVMDRGSHKFPLVRVKILAARVGLAPTPCGLTNRRATLTPPGNGAAGRILTCIVPFRRRMPDNFDHGSNLKI